MRTTGRGGVILDRLSFAIERIIRRALEVDRVGGRTLEAALNEGPGDDGT